MLKRKMSVTLTVIAMILLVQACRKFDFTTKESKTTEFTVAVAKEWYYGVFKKSDEYKNSLPGKQFDQLLNQKESSNNNLYPTVKYPYWNLGLEQVSANVEIVELPVMYTLNKIMLPGTSQMSAADRDVIYEGILNRLLIIKKPNGTIATRILNYIPDKEYLEANANDITDEKLTKLHENFTGYLIIRKWNEQILAGYKMANGVIVGIMKFNTNSSNTNLQHSSRTNVGETCTDECVPIENLVCVGNTNGGGDVPPPEPDCPEFSGECEWVTTCVPDPEEPPIDPPGDGEEGDPCAFLILDECSPTPPGDEPPQEPNDTIADNPCEHANALANNTDVKAKLELLKNLTTANKEYGFMYDKSNTNGMTNITPLIGNEGEAGINFPVNSQIDGMMHSHYTGLLSIFSPDDIYTMAQIYTNNGMINPGEFTLTVVTSSGTQYTLLIDDMVKFQEFASNLVNNSALDIYKQLYNDIYRIKPNNTAEQNERAFLQYIQQSNSGLKLFKGNSNFSEWQPKKVDENGNIVNNPC